MSTQGHHVDSRPPPSSGAATTISGAASKSAAARSIHALPHPEFVWYGILGVLAFATAANTCYVAWAAYRRYRACHGGGITTTSYRGTGRLTFSRIPHAFLSASRILSFRLRLPGIELTLAEMAFTALFMSACLAVTFSPTDNTLPRVNLEAKWWGNIAGVMTTIQVPFAVLLALKNSPITLLTGVGHEKLNLMHRVVSRCILLLAWLHLVGMYLRAPALMLNAPYKVCGLVGLVAQTITSLTSFKLFRRRFYELFYASHVLLVLIFLVTIHIHVAARGFGTYIWPVWLIWGLDRALRAGRSVLFNIILHPKDLPSHALIEVVGADTLRVTLHRCIPGGWTAGQHVFLAFPALGPQSHPFTIANTYEPETESEGGRGKVAEMVFIIRVMNGVTRRLMERALPVPGAGRCELASMVDGPYGRPADLRPFSTCVFIAGGTGVTYTIARMHQLLKDVHAADACAHRVVFVWAVRGEADYKWLATDLEKIVAAAPMSISLAVEVYLTGGRKAADAATVDSEKDGAPTTVSQVPLDEEQKQEQKNRHPSSSSSRVFNVETCSVRGSESEVGDCGSSDCGAICISPTESEMACIASTASLGGPDTTPTHRANTLPTPPHSVRQAFGRPDVYSILEEEVTASDGAVAVDVSGPDGLVDAVRNALCARFAGPVAALRGASAVLLNVEQFRM